MFKWLNDLFKKKETEKVIVHFKLPDREIDIEAIKILKRNQPDGCKIHPSYTGTILPTNNCNICWEFYSQMHKR